MNNRKILLSIAIGIIAVLLFSVYLKKEEKRIFGGEPAEILVAGKDIPRETVITEEMLAKKSIPKDFVHPHSIYPYHKDMILGQPARYNLVKGQPILWSDIGKSEGGLSSRLNAGERAMSIAVDEVRGVAGNLRPNDRVDVLGTFEVQGRLLTKVLMQNVTIIGVGSAAIQSSTKEQSEMNMVASMINGPYSCVTVAVTPAEAQVLTLAQERGRLSLVLRSSLDLDIDENLAGVDINSLLSVEKGLTTKRKERTEIIKGGVAEDK